MSASLFEQLVLGKPYFDRHGLIVAANEGQIVGFAHGGFGPTEDFSALSTDAAVTAMVMVARGNEHNTIADHLLSRCEQYLRSKGARVLYGGEIFPLNPFYLGLYGGSEQPGVLVSDRDFTGLLRRSGYGEIDRCFVLHLDLSRFRPAVDRRQLNVRRLYQVESTSDRRVANWWQACTSAPSDYRRFEIQPRGGQGTLSGSAVFWNMEPLCLGWAARAAGLVQLEVDEARRRQGLATHLLGEAFRQLRSEGISLVEVQVMQHNVAALALYAKLGFREVDQGVVFRKES
jgi:GNAT superfamily N-acetyltransferase